MRKGESKTPGKRFKNQKELAAKWDEYKKYCDTHTVRQFQKNRLKKTENNKSDKSSKRLDNEVSAPITYSIEGFCAWCKLSRSAFYDTYDNEKYSDIVTRMREECEVDARQKFETGVIPVKLAGLWMSKFGYTVNAVSQSGNGDGTQNAENSAALISALNTKAAEVWEDEAKKN